MNDRCSIYALVDPRDSDTIRYIGVTRNINSRFFAHLRDVRNCDTHKARWLRKIQAEGFTPELKVIEVCRKEERNEREIYWISQMRKEGHPLVNSTRGGDGVVDSESARLKMLGNKNGLGHVFKATKATREKMRLSHLGKGVGNQHGSGKNLGNLHALGYKHTPEARAKMSQKLVGNSRTKGRKMPEAEKQIRSLANKGIPKKMETAARIAQANRARPKINRAVEHINDSISSIVTQVILSSD